MGRYACAGTVAKGILLAARGDLAWGALPAVYRGKDTPPEASAWVRMGLRALRRAVIGLGLWLHRGPLAAQRFPGRAPDGDVRLRLPEPGRVDLATAGIDGVYVVHCKALAERERYLATALRMCGIEVDWVEAFDAEELPRRVWRERVANRHLTPQEVSLFLKHERVFGKVLARGQRAAVVLEDDVVLPPDFCARVEESLRTLPPGYDLVFMGPSCGMHVAPDKGTHFGRATRSRSTCAYVVTAACCRMILEETTSIDLPVDHHLDRIITARGLRVWWHEPPLVGQGSESGVWGHSLGLSWRQAAGGRALLPGVFRKGGIRRALKAFRSLAGLVYAARALPRDARALCWRLRRRRQIAAYLAFHEVRKLNLGCGPNPIPGWLNTEVEPRDGSVAFLDAAAPFPLPSASFDFVFAEHMIEHIPRADGLAMLRECARVLKPGGVIRIATPDLRRLAGLLARPEGAAEREYVREATDRFLPHSRRYRPGLVVNNFFTGFGHAFIYDAETLRDALEDVGFEHCRAVESGASRLPELAGLEGHSAHAGEAINRFETMIFEAEKPRP